MYTPAALRLSFSTLERLGKEMSFRAISGFCSYVVIIVEIIFVLIGFIKIFVSISTSLKLFWKESIYYDNPICFGESI